MTPKDRLASLGLVLPEPPKAAAVYSPFTREGNLVFVSGQVRLVDGRAEPSGKLGAELTTDDGRALARLLGLQLLSLARAAAGDLSSVRFIKLVCFVASTPDFTEQHLVANGASELIAEVIGGPPPARSAIGVPVLPLSCPVEIEAVLSISRRA